MIRFSLLLLLGTLAIAAPEEVKKEDAPDRKVEAKAPQVEVSKLFEVVDDISCVFTGKIRRGGFTGTTQGQFSGNGPLGSILDNACESCNRSGIPCELYECEAVQIAIDPFGNEVVQARLVLEIDPKQIDISCPQNNPRKERIPKGATVRVLPKRVFKK